MPCIRRTCLAQTSASSSSQTPIEYLGIRICIPPAHTSIQPHSNTVLVSFAVLFYFLTPSPSHRSARSLFLPILFWSVWSRSVLLLDLISSYLHLFIRICSSQRRRLGSTCRSCPRAGVRAWYGDASVRTSYYYNTHTPRFDSLRRTPLTLPKPTDTPRTTHRTRPGIY